MTYKAHYKTFVSSVDSRVYIKVYGNSMNNLNGYCLGSISDNKDFSPLEIKGMFCLTEQQKLDLMSQANDLILNLRSLGLEELDI